MNQTKQMSTYIKENLINEIFSIINEARSIKEVELCQKTDYKNNPDLRYPQTKSEQIVDKLLTLLLNDLIDCEDEPILDEMCNFVGQLDMDVNQPNIWKDLFKLADEYKNSKIHN